MAETNGNSSDDPLIPVTDELTAEIADGLRLLDYAVESGFKKETVAISAELILSIKTMAGKAGFFDRERKDRLEIKTSDWAKFELACYQLAILLSPVTAETLRNTEDPLPDGTLERAGWLKRLVLSFSAGHSPAVKFTRQIWFYTVVFASIVIFGDWLTTRYGPVQEGEVDGPNTLLQVLQVLTPYAYGGLGACVYLLRTGHAHIYGRSFDLRRRPEYYNRILLGTVSGGAIILFVGQVAGEDGTVIQLSSAALGFLAGYSSDFLFNTIERLINALLPKVGLQSIRQATPAARSAIDVAAGGLTMKDLLDRLEKAKGAEKQLIQSLIEKLRDRL